MSDQTVAFEAQKERDALLESVQALRLGSQRLVRKRKLLRGKVNLVGFRCFGKA